MGMNPDMVKGKPKRPLIGKGGRFHIVRRGFDSSLTSDFYHSVLQAKWGKFFFVVSSLYVFLNLFFGMLYYLGGDCIFNAENGSFWDAFVFSIQTSSTIGYGYFAPKTTYANVVVGLNSIVSLLFTAVVTGMAFARFSRPSARVIFSDKLLIANYHGKPMLMFRVGNARSNQIVDARINAVVLKSDTSPEGMRFRRLEDLSLVRSHSPVFALTWTIFHPIDESSPLYALAQGEKISESRDNVDMVISFTGIDDVFAQTVHAKHAYSFSDIVRGKGFVDMMYIDEEGQRIIDYSKFHKILP